MFTDRSRRAVTIGIVVLASLGLIGMLMAPMAAGHDRLTGSSPEDGERVESPGELVLEFSGELSRLGTAVEVSGPDGAATDGQPLVEGDTVRQPLADDLAPGGYDVTWRVTSGDGHPISGELSFEVTGSPGEGAEQSEEEPEPTTAAGDGADAAQAAGEGEAATGSPADEEPTGEDRTAPTEPEEASGLPWLWILLGVVAGGAVVALLAARRRS